MSDPTNLFLYGTLRHEPLLMAVAGEAVGMRPARLAEHTVWRVKGHDFPVILPDSDGSAEGSLITVGPGARARLDYYEAAYHYELRVLEVATENGTEPALVYFARELVEPSGDRWSLDDWVAKHGALTVEAAEEAMSGFDRVDPPEMGRRYPRIRARAWSRMLAARDDTPATLRRGALRGTVEERARQTPHSGFFALHTVTLDHPTFLGARSGDVVREVFVGTDAALILPYDPRTDCVLLVEQFRAGPYVRGEKRPSMLEPIAGLVDPGEEPQETARREAIEEAGLHLERLIEVFRGYPSPGATTEFYHCFVGLCDLSEAGGQGGLAHEGEDIWSHVLPLTQALELVETGEANIIPSVAMLYWLAINRGRLDGLS